MLIGLIIRVGMGFRLFVRPGLLFLIFIYSFQPLLALDSKAKGMAVGKLRVGVVLPFSGSQKDYGSELYVGIQMALTKVRQIDPEFGAKMELVKADDKSSVRGVHQAVSILQKQRVHGYIGSVTESNSKKLAELVQKMKKPLVVPVASSLEFEPWRSYTYHANYQRHWQGRVLAQLVLNPLKKKRVAIVYDGKSQLALDTMAEFLRGIQQTGVQVVMQEDSSAHKRSYMAMAERVIEKGAELLFYPSENPEDVRNMIQSLSRSNADVPLLGLDVWGEPSFRQKVGSYLAGQYYLLPFSHRNELDKSVKWFTAEFVARTKRYPSAVAYLGYDSLMMFYAAFKQAQSERSEELLRVMRTLQKVPGLLGEFALNEKAGYAEKSAVVIQQMEGGLKRSQIVSF